MSNRRRKLNPEIDNHLKPVEYWTDEHHVTWYKIHEKNFLALLSTIYEIPKTQEETPDCNKCLYLPKGQIGKCQKGRQENALLGDSMLNAKTADRKMPKGNSDLLQRSLTENRINTTTTDNDAAVVVEKINSLIRKKKKGALISIAFIKSLCEIHQTTHEQILLCAQALAEIPSIKSIAGMMMGTKDSDGCYQSSCFLGGVCILATPEPEQPMRKQFTPKDIDYEKEIQKIDDETKKAIMKHVEADMIQYKSKMSQQNYESTLQVGYDNALAQYVYQLKYEFTDVTQRQPLSYETRGASVF